MKILTAIADFAIAVMLWCVVAVLVLFLGLVYLFWFLAYLFWLPLIVVLVIVDCFRGNRTI